MPIPNYQSIMLPLLNTVSDEKEYFMREVAERLAEYFNLSQEDLKELLPSGQQYLFYNRVGWARTYLKKAGLIDSPQRGIIKITKRGLEVLTNPPKSIDNNFLKQFPEFNEFVKGTKKSISVEATKESEDKTPGDLIEENFQYLYNSLSAELLERIKLESPQFFEELVIDLLLKMGYGGSRKDAGQAIGKSGDGGIDGIIKEDKLGLDTIYVQAKRWENVVSRPTVQAFAGSLEGVRANRGILITTSHFTKEAKEYVKNIGKSIVLVDGELLTQLMIDHNLGVSPIAKYEVKKIDLDYFIED